MKFSKFLIFSLFLLLKLSNSKVNIFNFFCPFNTTLENIFYKYVHVIFVGIWTRDV